MSAGNSTRSSDAAVELLRTSSTSSPGRAVFEPLRHLIDDNEPADFWYVHAVMQDSQGNTHKLMQRFERLQLLRDTTLSAASSWSFDQLVKVTYQNETERYSYPQRVALELAGVDEDQQRVWVDGFSFQAQQALGGCQNSYTLASPYSVLTYTQTDCAQRTDTDSMALSSLGSMPVVGTLQRGSASVAITGVGRIEHGHADVLNMQNGAVLLDRLWLVIDELGEIDIVRTKRRSGRGPTTSVATLNATDAVRDIVVSTQNDQGSAGWRISSKLLQLDVHVISVPPDGRFAGVTATGSHSGAGFIDFQRIDASSTQ